MPESASATPATGSAPVPLASALAGGPTSFVRADVALGSEPVVGSFTVDGMTFAVVDDDAVELVGVASGWQPGDPSEALAVPASATYEGVTYAVSSIGAYAFYLSGVASVALPASVGNVDERAFRSSDVASVEADPASGSFASFDGALYSADLTRLLLIPGGRQGAVRIPSQALDAPASAFSHCALVTAIDADAGGAAYSAWEGLLYDAAGMTLLRVPAGATDITIREGCTAIAAGALEGCASLSTITAPASVTSVSPDVFASVPTVGLPAASALADDPGASTGATEEPSEQAGSAPASGSTSTQITALVALSSTADGLPEVDPGAITVLVPEGADGQAWEAVGCLVERSIGLEEDEERVAALSDASLYADYELKFYGVTIIGGGYIKPEASDEQLQTYGLWTAYPIWTITLASGGYHSVWIKNIAGDTKYLQRATAYANPGYYFAGWTLSPTGDSPQRTISAFSGETSVGCTVYAVFSPYSYAVSFNANGGSGGQTANVTATYDAAMPTIATTAPTRAGYVFMGWYDTSAATGGTQYYTASGASARTWDKTAATTLYARWKQRPVSTVNLYMDETMTELYRTVYVWYEVGWYDTPTPTESTAQLTTIGTPARPGYAYYGFRGTTSTGAQGTWWKDVTVFPAVKSATLAGATTAKTTDLYAVWTPVVAADVPLEVTARVDLLGIEEQEEAKGYIESRCGEPLTVAGVAFEPLSGATELFGAASVADVALEVLAAGSTSPDARFKLDASTTQAPASSAAFRMASYGTRVPISYRFAIPDELLPSLVEATKPVCSVAYTVALA